jgi:dienelactone hydrolase
MKNYRKISIYSFLFTAFFMFISFMTVSNKEAKITGEEVTYTLNGTTFKGYVAYDASTKNQRPGILVVHEWWGNNDYSRMRARKLAELGYIALAVDMYGDGKIASNPQEAQQLSGEVYKNIEALKDRMEAAEEKLKTYNETDKNNIGAIGYCFGGSVVLNAAKMGMDFKGVVSFHGSLAGVPAKKDLLKAKILVCHGGADKFETDEDVKKFRSNLDSVGAAYIFKVYPGAMHAFTNPAATELGKKFNIPIAYNEAADKNSWNDMKDFFSTIFKK